MAPDRELPVVAADSVGIDYRTADRVVTAIDDVSVQVAAASFTVLAGPSGSGKSSLLRTLGLLDTPTRGTVQIGGVEVTALDQRGRRRLRRRRLAYVHQRPVTNLVDDLTAAQQVRFARASRGMAEADPIPLLRQFGLEHRASARPAQLSGGEQQRLAVAMAAAAEPLVLFADEPTAELDRHHANEVIAALASVATAGRAVVVASHDPELVAAASHVIRLLEGRLVHD